MTKPLGERLQLFAGKITKDFVVKELPKETAAKAWCTAANLRQKTAKGKGKAPVKKSTKGKQTAKQSTTKGEKPEKKPISMSLLTYKLHALGDYAQTIREHGTTDSYSSQTVSIFIVFRTYLISSVGRI